MTLIFLICGAVVVVLWTLACAASAHDDEGHEPIRPSDGREGVKDE